MTSVTVDLEDLEALVWVTGVIKTIEGALASHKQDPFVRPYLDFTEAHDRLATEMRNARRVEAGTLVPWDGELEKEEIEFLKHLSESELLYNVLTAKQKAPLPGKAMSVADELSAKGCVAIGTKLEGVIWAGAAVPELHKIPEFLVMITPRGEEKLRAAEAKALAK